MPDESMDDFLSELDGSNALYEGEAQTYFEHAVNLRDTIRFLRRNHRVKIEDTDTDTGSPTDTVRNGFPVDLLRVESVNTLDAATLRRVLQRNYVLLLSLTPLEKATRTIMSCSPPHVGPAIAEMCSAWYRLWLYREIGRGPVTIYFVAGTRVRRVPKCLKHYQKMLLTSSTSEVQVVGHGSLLAALNDSLCYSPVLVQGYGHDDEAEVLHVPFPLPKSWTEAADGPDMSSATHTQSTSPASEELGNAAAADHDPSYKPAGASGPKTTDEQQPDKCVDDNVSASIEEASASIEEASASIEEASAAAAEPASHAGLVGNEADCGDAKKEPFPAHASTEAALVTAFTDKDSAESEWKARCLAAYKAINAEALRDKLMLQHSCGYLTLVRRRPEMKYPASCSGSGNTKAADDLTDSDWDLFGINHGIPIFNSNVNKAVCQGMLDHQLLSPPELHSLTQAQRQGSLQLLQFIQENQVLNSLTIS